MVFRDRNTTEYGGAAISVSLCVPCWCPFYKYCTVTLEPVSDDYAPLEFRIARVMFQSVRYKDKLSLS